MLPYYLFFVVIMFLTLLARERKLNAIHKNINVNNDNLYKYIQFFIIVSLILFVGLRKNTGSDYGNYVNLYQARKNNTFLEIFSSGFEISTDLFVKIASLIYDDPAIFFVIYASITYILYVKVIFENATDILFAMCIFMLAGPFLWPFGAIRQCLAAAIIFAGHKYMYERKFLKWLLVVFVAFLCHATALVMLPIYFICRMKINFKSTVILVLLSFVIMYSYDFLFSIMSFVKGSEQSQYEYMNAEVNVLRVLVTLAPIVVYLFVNKKAAFNQKEQFYILMSFLNTAFMISTSQSAYLARISIYTELYTIMTYPILLKSFDYKSKMFAKIVITVFFFIYFSFQLQSANLSNYSNVLFW